MPEEKIVNKRGKIGIIETIRGLAALAVCLFHFSKGNIEFIGSTVWYQRIVSNGWLGVEAFFVVSGFIIPYSLVKSGYTVKRFFQFLAKRCLRIEPPYLLSIVLVILLGYLSTLAPGFKGEAFRFNTWQTLSHIAYLPAHLGFNWLLPVYWTLEAEFHYYILIGLLLPFLWKNQTWLLIGFVCGLAASFFIPLYVFSFMPLFVMGMAVCAVKTGKLSHHILWIVLAIAVSVSLIKGQPFSMTLVGALTAILICYAAFRTKATDFLGKISYSLYLLHVPIGGRIINLFGRYANTEWKVWGILLTALFVTLIASWIFYKLVEYPSQLLSKKITYRHVKAGTDHIPQLSTH
jgi:peptidoglycan/LPS O-acetylase OafA/YrhL